MKDNGDGLQIYCTKNVCPLLGDHKYSSRVEKIFGKPVLVSDIMKVRPKPQVY